MKNIRQQDVVQLLKTAEAPRLFVLADHQRVSCDVQTPAQQEDALLKAHLTFLDSVSEQRQLLMPAFSQAFLRQRKFDLTRTPSESGTLSEAFRRWSADWRSHDPIFSVCGQGPRLLNYEDEVHAFGPQSLFEQLRQEDTEVLFYGTSIEFASVWLYHAEASFNAPYQQPKRVEGKLINNALVQKIQLHYHTPPRGLRLHYDWGKITNDLRECGALQVRAPHLMLGSAKGIFDCWGRKLQQDPLYFLDPETKRTIEPHLPAQPAASDDDSDDTQSSAG